MNARDGRRAWASVAAGVAAVGFFGSGGALGQAPADGRVPVRTKGAAKPAGAPPSRTTPADDREPVVEGTVKRVPINPTDAVAVVNGEAITRAALAEEAFMREGEKVLDALISRKLIDQAMKAKKITVTAQEVDAEIDKYANNVAGVPREEWLRNLAREKKISAAQYKNDIIYPGIALRKLAENRVQVTDKDMKDALDAHFGEKLRCRIILCLRERDAIDLWNELKKNPGAFAHLAKNDVRSIDQATKAHGGLLEQPLTRHAYPREVSDKAFQQLVDGDPQDRDPSHKPKDGDVSGPIQVNKETWLLMKREGVDAAMAYDPKDPTVRKTMHSMIYDAKLKEAMSEVFEELVKNSAVENRLTGQVKVANEDQQPDSRVDGNVRLMSDPGASVERPSTEAGQSARSRAASAAVKPEDRAAVDGFKKTASGNGAPASAKK